MEEAGIDKTIIFPVNNHTYEKANEAIAEICGSHPGKLIGFAKHDPESEAGAFQPCCGAKSKSWALRD
jgi:predicted TIM-barrel fold metal-dependent hydrolase